MSGYKTTALSYNPVLFTGFDGEAWDENTFAYSDSPVVIFDESGNGNHGMIHDSGSATGHHGYRAGVTSLVELELYDTAACSFGWKGFQHGSPNGYEKAYVEIPHSNESLHFPNASFSVSLIMERENVSEYRNKVGNHNSLIRPIIDKNGVFRLYMSYPSFSHNRLVARCPDGELIQWGIPNDFHNGQNHIVFTWDVKKNPDTGDWYGRGVLYVNSRVVGEHSVNYYDEKPNMNYPTSVLIGGTLDDSVNHNDRCTEKCTIDQIAIYDYALSAGQVSRLFRKVFRYDSMIKRADPKWFFRFSDADDPNIKTLFNEIKNSSVEGVLNGMPDKIALEQPGPNQIYSSLSARVVNGGQIIFRNTTYSYSPVFDSNSDYTLEFWFSAASVKSGTLALMASENMPFPGLVILANTFNNGYRTGALQFQFDAEKIISVEGNYTDGYWHHAAVTRKGNNISVYLNGIHCGDRFVSKNNQIGKASLSFFTAAPGSQAIDGALSHLAVYDRALDFGEINARANYRRIYKIRGQVTLRGIPTSANVRCYSHNDGNLVTEVISDLNTGDYLVELYDNRLIDMMVLNAENHNIKYRVYGPVKPSEYDDDP